jgi:hypothetical protein
MVGAKLVSNTCEHQRCLKQKKFTPGNNPEDFKQHYDHGGSLQLHIPLVY